MPLVARFIRKVRADEWILLAFLAYCLARVALGSASVAATAPPLRLPHPAVLAVFLLVAGLRVGLRLRETRPRILPAIVLAEAGLLFFVDRTWTGISLCLALLALFAATGGRGALRALLADLRDCFALLALIALYPLTALVIQKAGVPDQDALMDALDRRLFGGLDPHGWLEAHAWLPLSRWLVFCYLSYGLLVIGISGLLYLRKEPRAFRSASFALCLTLALGYTGYTLLPVRGPAYAWHFTTDLDLGTWGQLKAALIDQSRVDRDCFPSLHTAVTLVLSWACWRFARPIFWLTLPIVLCMPLACVYLRYHFVVDVLAGALLGGAVIGVARWRDVYTS